MEGTYLIDYRGKTVGQASVEQQGLYYSFSCNVNMQKKGLYRISVIQNEGKTDLGICIPNHDRYMLTKKIPIKKFGNGKFTFAISDGNDDERFVPIVSQEPFAYLSILEKGRLTYQGGIPGVIFPGDWFETCRPQ